jgi:alcohol dehydrogenase, propanol-preferring
MSRLRNTTSAVPQMRAMGLDGPGQALRPGWPRLHACALCRTDLHVVDRKLTEPKLPLIPGHQVVGEVMAVGAHVKDRHVGGRVGVPWLGWTCGIFDYCTSERENLCDRARFTGYTFDGGYADYMVADARFCFPIPHGYPDEQAAPLLCAGLIGYRSLRAAGHGQRLGVFGLDAAAHIVAQGGPPEGSARRRRLPAQVTSRGDTEHPIPEELDAAIIFAPAPLALCHCNSPRRGVATP